MAIYKVKHGQSIYDIATQIYGSVLGIVHLLRDNESINLTTYLETGREININPTSDTILDQNIVNFFAKKTITNSETLQNTSKILSEVEFVGEILTQNTAGENYIDGIMWAVEGQLNMESRVTNPLSFMNRDRVQFNSHFTLNNDGDELEFIVNYGEHISGRWYPLADSTSVNNGAYIFFNESDGQLYMCDDEANLLIANPVSTNHSVDITVKIRCEVTVTDSVLKSYFLSVNGVEESAIDVNGSNLSFDTLGGFAQSGVGIGDGFNGIFKYLKYNNDEYKFDQGKGIYIFKNI